MTAADSTACATDTAIMDAAISYARGGHRVFPVDARRKCPLRPPPAPGDPDLPLADWQDRTKGGFHAGVCDERLVHTWWSARYRGAGIGYSIPPDVFVLDDDGGDGPERVRSSLLAGELRRCTSVVETARGRHFYFRLPAGAPCPARGAAIGLPRDHIRRIFDVKGGGAGYSILPPSPGKAWLEGSLDTAPEASEELLRALSTDG